MDCLFLHMSSLFCGTSFFSYLTLITHRAAKEFQTGHPEGSLRFRFCALKTVQNIAKCRKKFSVQPLADI